MNKPPEPRTWDTCRKDFIKLLPQVSPSHDIRTLFCDVCRIFSLSLRGAMAIGDEKRKIEEEYSRYAESFKKEGMDRVAMLFAIVVEALEIRRSDFLGHIYEELNATNKHFGQFFTPDHVSRLMAKVVFHENPAVVTGRIVTLYDGAAGAGALLIEGAEEFVSMGGRQADIMVYADDLDSTACCITYVQLSLLGYPAAVRRMDTILQKVYEGPWYTFGYFAHGTSFRLLAQKRRERVQSEPETVEQKPAPTSPSGGYEQGLLPLFA